MQPSKAPYVIGAGACVLLIAVLAFFVGRGCPQSIPKPVDETGIDAGPGDQVIASTLDGAVQHADEQLARIEREHAADIAQFNDTQAHKYDAVRAQGPDAVSDFLAAFNDGLRDAGAP